jgi:YHS domain-containing protein
VFRRSLNDLRIKAAALSLAVVLSAAVMTLASASAVAAQDQNRMVVSAVVIMSSSAYAVANNGNRGIGLGGFDPVAYKAGRGTKIGRADIEADWRGMTYRFNSELNRNVFIANPKVFLAQFDGHCALGAATGQKVAADPNAWAVHDGKIYLFSNQRMKSTWQKNAGINIARAETNWPSIR